MAVLKVEIVVGTVKVGGHYGHVVAAVLQAEALAHLKPGYLGYGVRLVGILELRRQQGVLAHGLGRHARIDARAAEEEQLLNIMAEALADDVLLYLQVLVDEVGTIAQVGHYAAHMGCGQHYGVGTLGVEKGLYGGRVKQVELGVAAAYEVVVAPGLEIVPDGRAYQPAMAGDVYL